MEVAKEKGKSSPRPDAKALEQFALKESKKILSIFLISRFYSY